MSENAQHYAHEIPVLLVFNCHEAWVHQLRHLGFRLDIIVGLKGQYKDTWDEQMRPVPPNSRLISLSDALESKIGYYCIIAHNIADLLDVKLRSEPKLLVIHSTLEGRALEEKSDIKAREMREMLHKYLDFIGAHALAVSRLKGNSWELAEDIVPFCADVGDYLPHLGNEAAGLRISNFASSRRRILLWDLHEKAFAGLPIRLVGHNPDLPAVAAARNWDHLKQMLQSHRFYIHTADADLEDGYNMATVEAMAAGMPILGNRHPGSPIEHGVSGFLSDDPHELREYAQILLGDRDLANKMGLAARKRAIERFSVAAFRNSFAKSIEVARHKTGALTAGNAP